MVKLYTSVHRGCIGPWNSFLQRSKKYTVLYERLNSLYKLFLTKRCTLLKNLLLPEIILPILGNSTLYHLLSIVLSLYNFVLL